MNAPSEQPPTPKRRRRRLLLACGCAFPALLLLLSVAGVLWILRSPLYHHWILYPRYEAALAELAAQREDLPADTWQDFRCVVHSHSYLSHDSVATPAEIVAAAHQVGVDALFMTDHPSQDNRELTQALIGEVSGVIFFPGYETSENMGVFPGEVTGELRSVVQYRPLKRLFDNIADRGGLVIYPHPETPNRRWDLTNFQGMEIYNIHTDVKDVLEDRKKVLGLLVEDLVCGERFPYIGFRSFFDEPTAFLEIWDGLNQGRRVFATAGNDAHQNTSFSLRMTEAGDLGFYFPATEEVPSATRGGWVGTLAGWLAEANGEIFSHQLDPYARSIGYVNTYLLAEEKTPDALFEALSQGRGYVAFSAWGDPKGFRLGYRTAQGTALLGQETPFVEGGVLEFQLPFPCQVRWIRNGELLETLQGVRSGKRQVESPGVYRLEARIEVAGEDWPFLYSNPIRILASS